MRMLFDLRTLLLVTSLSFLMTLSVPAVKAPSVGYQNFSTLFLHDSTIRVGTNDFMRADFTPPDAFGSNTKVSLGGGTQSVGWYSPAISAIIERGDWNVTLYYSTSQDTNVDLTIFLYESASKINTLLDENPVSLTPPISGPGQITVPLGSISTPIALTAYRLVFVVSCSLCTADIYYDTPQTPSRVNMPFVTLDAAYPPPEQPVTTVTSLALTALVAALVTVSTFAGLTLLRRTRRH